MSEKQAHLNGAYYGPSIPPREKTPPRPQRWPPRLLLQLHLRPHLQAYLHRSGLHGLSLPRLLAHSPPTRIATSTITSLSTSLSETRTRRSAYYDRIEATALYEGQRLSTAPLTPFYQGHKTTNVLNPVFKGQQLIVGSNLLEEFNQQKSAGVYEIEMKLYLRIRFKLGRIKTGKFKPRIECDLKVPFSENGNSVGTFQTEKCSIDYFD
ncbi:hypothetical protein M0R45_029945 [Rubus argutus]|uniref:Uncharacterized protein n=1 Tax=Rubus argutus TaxID=59490 RepID=A0AAW1W9R8_RUBAR